RAELDRVGALADGDVLDKVPNVVVFEGGPPLSATESGISAGGETWQTAIRRVSRGRIIPADSKLAEQVGIRIGADARCYQASEARAGFGDNRWGPDTRVADLSVAVEVDLTRAIES